MVTEPRTSGRKRRRFNVGDKVWSGLVSPMAGVIVANSGLGVRGEQIWRIEVPIVGGEPMTFESPEEGLRHRK